MVWLCLVLEVFTIRSSCEQKFVLLKGLSYWVIGASILCSWQAPHQLHVLVRFCNSWAVGIDVIIFNNLLPALVTSFIAMDIFIVPLPTGGEPQCNHCWEVSAFLDVCKMCPQLPPFIVSWFKELNEWRAIKADIRDIFFIRIWLSCFTQVIIIKASICMSLKPSWLNDSVLW